MFGRFSLRTARDVFLQKNFEKIEKYLGVHIVPVHYYSPLPELGRLDARAFEKRYECRGIDWNIGEQMRHLEQVYPKYRDEFRHLIARDDSIDAFGMDTFIHYSMIRENKPKTMVEIGAGGSTKVSLAALEKNRSEGCGYTLRSIDPNPLPYLRTIRNDSFDLIAKRVQDVDLNILEEADLLFVDSSHVSKIDSDVNFEVLELCPRLRVGTIVQWHDIMFPAEYWSNWIRGGMFFNESYLLHAFMLFNSAFKPIWASRYMQMHHDPLLRERFAHLGTPDLVRSGVSFWVQRIA